MVIITSAMVFFITFNFIIILLCIFIYLTAPGSSLSKRDLFFFFSSCCMWNLQLPDQGSNLGLLHWELGVLVTGPPGKSLNS